MKTSRRALGDHGERLAAEYLKQRGYTIIAAGAQVGHGEIDLIAEQGDTLVFVEVKTRTSDAFGSPEESVGELKQQRLRDAVARYMNEMSSDRNYRIDVIAITLDRKSGKTSIEHYESAIGEE